MTVTAELTYSTAHERHEVLAWPRAALRCWMCELRLERGSSLLRHGCVHWARH